MNNDHFTALRSIHKEPWVIVNNEIYRILWRIKNTWYYIDPIGIRTKEDATVYSGRYGYESIYNNAVYVAAELIDRGMVELFTERCCPGTNCHLNDRMTYRLTANGVNFIAAISTCANSEL